MTSNGSFSGISGNIGAIWDDRATPDMINAQSAGFKSQEVSFLLTQSTGRDVPNGDYFHRANAQIHRSLHMETSSLATLYFSQRNVDRIQCMLKGTISNRTGGKVLIVDQDADDLRVAMQSIFDESAQNLKENVAKQVIDLNNSLVDKYAAIIITNIKQEMGYKRDIAQRPAPMDNPTNVSTKGRKTLPSATTVWQNPNWQTGK
jgi:hypothetical protein